MENRANVRQSEATSGSLPLRPQVHALALVVDGDCRAALSHAALDQTFIADAPAALVVSAVYRRTSGKYGARGIRYAHIEVGHVAQNVYLQAEALGLGTVTVGAFVDEQVRAMIGAAAGSSRSASCPSVGGRCPAAAHPPSPLPPSRWSPSERSTPPYCRRPVRPSAPPSGALHERSSASAAAGRIQRPAAPVRGARRARGPDGGRGGVRPRRRRRPLRTRTQLRESFYGQPEDREQFLARVRKEAVHGQRLDYLFCSKALRQHLTGLGVERRGMADLSKLTGGAQQPLPEVKGTTTAASDHAAVYADFDLP